MGRICSLVFVALAGLLTASPLGAQGFSLEQVTSAPFSSELRAAPKGERFVWISNQRGRRNLWVAEAGAAGYGARALTHYEKDDGVDLGDVTWTPDGESVIYVRGGDFEFPGKPSPNPGLLPGGVTQEIWLVGLRGGEPRRLAEGRSPAVSPDGTRVVFLSKGEVFALSLREKGAKPVQMFHARGEIGSLLWSPDGRALAFTSGRGDHGFVGVYAVGADSLTYMEPSTDTDEEPVWSPDSRRIAFIRIAHDAPGGGFKPHRTATPWGIWVGDAATGGAREIWKASLGPGSAFHDLAAEHQMMWAASDRIVFPWEGDGWLHLYSIAVAGGTAALLTPGAFEVEHVASGGDGRSVVYSSNQDAGGPAGAQDIDRRHVWRVASDGSGRPVALTHGEGIEVYPAVTAGGTVAVLRSDVRIPLRPAVLTAKGELKDVAPGLIPADFPGGEAGRAAAGDSLGGGWDADSCAVVSACEGLG